MTDEEESDQHYVIKDKLMACALHIEFLDKVEQMGKKLGVEVPKNWKEGVAMDPEKALPWAVRMLKLERKFHEVAGQDDLESVAEERLKEITLDPVDVQGARLCFTQFYSKLAIETGAALHRKITPERWSRLRGHGQLFETWMSGKLGEIAERMIDLDASSQSFHDAFDELKAVYLVKDPLQGATRSGSLLEFAQRVERAHNGQTPGQT